MVIAGNLILVAFLARVALVNFVAPVIILALVVLLALVPVVALLILLPVARFYSLSFLLLLNSNTSEKTLYVFMYQSSESPPRGNQVDGLPRALSDSKSSVSKSNLAHLGRMAVVWRVTN